MNILNGEIMNARLELIIVITFIISRSSSQQQRPLLPIDCNRAPPEFLEACRQLRQFDVTARRDLAVAAARPRRVINAPGVRNQQFSPALPSRASFAPTVYDCFDLQCACPFFGGGTAPDGTCQLRNGQTLQRAVRREIRTLSDFERQRLFNAIRQLKASGEYGRLATIHRQEATGSGAHSGPSFLPWHREFLKRVELALRLIDPSIALPYWDSSLDNYLPDPRDSIMWSPLLMGDTNQYGQVINGPFAGFATLEGRPTITRNLGREGHLFTDQNIAAVYAKNTIDGILAYTAPTQACPYPPNFSALEYYHASVHLWVGGDMKPPLTAANDPVFYLHHSFVDYLFEQWRLMHQNRLQRERDYPREIPTCATPLHFSNANMRPFNLVNIQGLSNAYTDNMYTYALRPTCSQQQPDCSSQFLFCDLRNGPAHCVSKIKIGGRCDRFYGEDACFGGVCIGGFCRPGAFNSAPQTPAPQFPPRAQTLRPRRPTIQRALSVPTPRPRTRNGQNVNGRNGRTSSLARAATTATCLNDDPCCSLWAEDGECPNNADYMSLYCRRSCGYCRNPEEGRSGCFDRHISCPYMQSQGECTRRRQWMAENCQMSCGWCNISPLHLCARVARMSRM